MFHQRTDQGKIRYQETEQKSIDEKNIKIIKENTEGKKSPI